MLVFKLNEENKQINNNNDIITYDQIYNDITLNLTLNKEWKI